MLRTDGEFVIYIVQHSYRCSSKWVTSEIGVFLFRNKALDGRTKKKFKELNLKYEANGDGDCWQQTGQTGTFDQQVAIDLMHLAAEYNKEHAFRVVALHVTQTTKQICSVYCGSESESESESNRFDKQYHLS